MVKFAIMGHGVVGSGTAQLFMRNQDKIEMAAGESMCLKYILDIKDFTGLDYTDLFIKDFSIIENDPEISVVVETIGGAGVAYEFVSRCLKAGKCVVTSNKELIATRGTELLGYAKQSGAMLKFEASVGGGIPLLKPINQCLAANQFVSIYGILNGTTNFILTKMETDNMSFEDALDTAKRLGYAELNPSADVDGHDCARKISILSGLAFKKHPHPDIIPTTGIRQITLDDIKLARACGGSMKLIGRAKPVGDGVSACVQPMVVDQSNQLFSVSDVFNGVIVDGDATGDVMFYGKGAGKFPTASAVISDIIDCAREKQSQRNIRWEDTTSFTEDDGTYEFLLKPLKNDMKKLAQLGELRRIVTDDGAVGYIVGPFTNTELKKKLNNLSIAAAVFPILK
ncbi:MAG TPA: homoserine dehydrogenase [Oscillospiraceae bacterium]|nr:homoserine dehydrogenase [Oscillospiraceae bacterium]HPK36301.1 homoserine dehydrogenase [Oscillospiraceae bacterium]HPR76073.1 homoserine dehydrogenase [Oscillospiraceae bacterium]